MENHSIDLAGGLSSNHRQVQPGLHFRHVIPLVGHVPHGAPTDALKQSEACSRFSMPLLCRIIRPATFARCNLAYISATSFHS
ncbi:hypothetical protein RB1716 [Rhodopirellula baltica SH 1]|uniref:Uncharacterized protein n=1 Tax=Rhodopirellula baltica (strain DSM 10527 / NCIMB 13988 / SH1) TaxID=243090 RepID=Q7UWX9_RHOBA|nr:hypothetical protein RB1716 [Rhodopirellula baltica SH 1]